jgi:lipocalin
MKIFLIILFMANLFSCKTAKELPTVEEVDISKYAGVWYEIAKLPNRFEKGLDCITATYTQKENGKIEVLNKGQKIKDKPQFKNIKGTAWVPNPDYQGRLKVSFFRPFSGDYYIIALDENYQYALVGSPSRKYLWVLSKNKDLKDSIYDELLKIAASNGFDVGNVVKVNQDCY